MPAIEDFLHPLRGWYRTSPAWLKRSLGQLYAQFPMQVRYGKELSRARRFLNESQWWSWEQHREYQWQQMRALLQHAYTNVPYYREVITKAGLKPEDIRSIEDWRHLPTLDKDTIRERKEDLVAENMRGKRLAANTGGSTGRPLEFYWELGRTRSLERAFMWRQWEWGGFRCGERTAVIRGQTVKEGLWHYDPIDKHLFVNAYQMSDEHARDIVAKLRRYRPVSIQAYPSTMTILADWMRRHREPPIPSIKVLLCGSENLYPAQKELFRKVFQARVFSWYGHGESCCMAGYCEQQDLYHIYSEYGYVELLDAAGNPASWIEGQAGEITGTSLVNNTMPLIRYRTGDIAVAGPDRCTCGRNYRLFARIDGRKQEYIITVDNRAIALTGVVFGQHWHAFSHIRQIQLVQSERGKVVIRIARGEGFSDADENEIREKILKCVVDGMEISFEYVAEIPPTARGKQMFVKQSLELPSAWAGDVEETICHLGLNKE